MTQSVVAAAAVVIQCPEHTAMVKPITTLCLLLVLIYVRLNGTFASGSNSKKYSLEGIECPKGFPPSVCGKNTLFPFPRAGRPDPTFTRQQRVIGILKQPRIGRSDPTLALGDDGWTDGSNFERIAGYHRGGLREREETLRNLQNYLSTQRKDSISPWAFFLITPNFQSSESAVDNIVPQLSYDVDDANAK